MQYLRLKNVVLVNYLDDFLIVDKSELNCRENIFITCEVLQNLGFIINKEKSVLSPKKYCKFLGFNINSETMEIELPLEKRTRTQKLLLDFKSKKNCKIREFSKLTGILVSSCPAVKYGFLYTRSFEREKFIALKKSGDDYDQQMSISGNLKEDFEWWLKRIMVANNDIRLNSYVIEIFSDASSTGWGVSCNEQKVHGWWNPIEKNNHINYLELVAAFYGLKCFAKDLRNSEILLRIDNTTAIAYVNKMGGIRFPHLHSLAKCIWQWCEERNLFIFASYISSKENIEADTQSRIRSTGTEWELGQKYFCQIAKKWQVPDIDLFASINNAKCKRYISWQRDPNSISVDAFTVSWSNEFFYAFPPFSMILRVIRKIIDDRAEGILVVPLWPTQVWFPLFKRCSVGEVLIFKPSPDLLLSPFREPHPLASCLTLVAGRLSGSRFV